MKRTINNYVKLFKATAEGLRRAVKENPGDPQYKNNLHFADEYDCIVRLFEDQKYFDAACWLYGITEDERK